MVEEEADLTMFYLGSAVAGTAIVTVTILVCIYLQNERKTNKNAIQDREKGPEMWGKKKYDSMRSTLDLDSIEERH